MLRCRRTYVLHHQPQFHNGADSTMMAAPSCPVARRRCSTKQPDRSAQANAVGVWAHALAAEQSAADGLARLQVDARRTHVHYTHVRTNNPKDVQPCDLTRKELWDHLMKCYQEVYPDASSATGSILQFGIVVKELHKASTHDHDRAEHHHAPTFSAHKHYWKRVKSLSAGRYNIQLNAVAHESYTVMYRYVRQPTGKKPLHELDQSPYVSPLHPQGDALKELLAIGDKCQNARAVKTSSEPGAGQVRSQFGCVYQWVVEKQLRGAKGAKRLQADAVKELNAGRPKLVEFVKKNKTCLEDQLSFCWELHDAANHLARMEQTRMEVLLEAASSTQAVCVNDQSKCADVYNQMLDHQGVDNTVFRHMLVAALQHGRHKGNAVMIVGGTNTGKTTITQPADLIYRCMPTPQSDSFCPLQDIRGFEVFLWHDLRYNPGHPHKDEQGLRIDEGTWNRFLEGLPTRIGVSKSDAPHADFVYGQDAAFISTGPFNMAAYRNGKPDATETEQLGTRVNYIEFKRPSPHTLSSCKPCALCWSRWLLEGELEWQHTQGVTPSAFWLKVATALGQSRASRVALPFASTTATASNAPQGQTPSSAAATLTSRNATTSSSSGSAGQVAPGTPFFNQLSSLIDWRAKGFISDTEFVNAKRKLGL